MLVNEHFIVSVSLQNIFREDSQESPKIAQYNLVTCLRETCEVLPCPTCTIIYFISPSKEDDSVPQKSVWAGHASYM